MGKPVVIDELHLTLRIPDDRPDDQVEAIQQILASAEFMSRLRRAIRSVFRAFPGLAVVRVSLTR
jgi:hypothetical protein